MPAVISCVEGSQGVDKIFSIIIEGVYGHFFRQVQNLVLTEFKKQRQLRVQIINLMVDGLTKTKTLIHAFLLQYTFKNEDKPNLDDLESLMIESNKEFIYDPILPIINDVDLGIGESFSDIHDHINNVIITWLEETEADFDYSTEFDGPRYLEYWDEGWFNLAAPEDNYIFDMGLIN